MHSWWGSNYDIEDMTIFAIFKLENALKETMVKMLRAQID